MLLSLHLGTMGEIVGLAAVLCERFDCDPRAIYAEHLEELMLIGAGKKTERSAEEPDPE